MRAIKDTLAEFEGTDSKDGADPKFRSSVIRMPLESPSNTRNVALYSKKRFLPTGQKPVDANQLRGLGRNPDWFFSLL